MSVLSCPRRPFSRCSPCVAIGPGAQHPETDRSCLYSRPPPLSLSQYNKYKTHFIQTQVPDGTSSTVYRCGPLIDFCAGPHITNTSKIKAFSVTKASSSYFMGDAKNDSLQRIYGISFPDAKQLADYKHWLEEAEKRNHRKIGKEQELFTFHDLSPGSPIFLPNGMKIYNALMELIREEYHERNYQEGAFSPIGSASILCSQKGLD